MVASQPLTQFILRFRRYMQLLGLDPAPGALLEKPSAEAPGQEDPGATQQQNGLVGANAAVPGKAEGGEQLPEQAVKQEQRQDQQGSQPTQMEVDGESGMAQHAQHGAQQAQQAQHTQQLKPDPGDGGEQPPAFQQQQRQQQWHAHPSAASLASADATPAATAATGTEAAGASEAEGGEEGEVSIRQHPPAPATVLPLKPEARAALQQHWTALREAAAALRPVERYTVRRWACLRQLLDL
jgi:hypothetical protein